MRQSIWHKYTDVRVPDVNPIQDGLFGAAHRWAGQKGTPP